MWWNYLDVDQASRPAVPGRTVMISDHEKVPRRNGSPNLAWLTLLKGELRET